MSALIAIGFALLLAVLAGVIVAYIYRGEPDATDEECSRVDDAVRTKTVERNERMAAYPSPF